MKNVKTLWIAACSSNFRCRFFFLNHSDGPSGVEEVTCIALLQKVLGEEKALAKLVPLPDVEWEQEWEDEERRKWHEKKMKSKVERPARHLELTGLSGWVHYC